MSFIKGYVDDIGSGFISGWVVREGQKDAVWVQPWVNGKKIKGAKANVYRGDIYTSKIHVDGYCGFYFGNLNLKKGDTLIIEVGNEKNHLQFTNNVINWLKDLPKLIPTKNCYFFLHIPKTAGTSFRDMLYQIFDQKAIIPNEEDIIKNNYIYPENAREFINSCSDDKLNNAHLLTGHYLNRPKEFFKYPPNLILFLRSPLQRSISHLLHLKRYKYVGNSLKSIYSQMPDMFYNAQVRFLAGYNRHGLFNENELEIAKKSLKKASFIGITNRFEESIELLEHTHNWKFKERTVTRNVNKQYAIEDLSLDLIEKIKKDNQLDQQLYDFGLELFEKRLAAIKE